MERLRRDGPVVALVVWTLFVWSTRFGTIWSDDGLDTAGKLGRTALALSFTGLALAVAAAWRRGRSRDRDRAGGALRGTVVALAAWTTAVWLVRTPQIVAGDHTTAFKLVHLVLAVVSVSLSALAVRSLRSLRSRPSKPPPGRRGAQGEQVPSATV